MLRIDLDQMLDKLPHVALGSRAFQPQGLAATLFSLAQGVEADQVLDMADQRREVDAEASAAGKLDAGAVPIGGRVDLDEATGFQLTLMSPQGAIRNAELGRQILLCPKADRIAVRIGPVADQGGAHHAQQRIAAGEAEAEGTPGVPLDQFDQVVEGDPFRQHRPGGSWRGLCRMAHCHVSAPVRVRRRKSGQIFFGRAGAFLLDLLFEGDYK